MKPYNSTWLKMPYIEFEHITKTKLFFQKSILSCFSGIGLYGLGSAEEFIKILGSRKLGVSLVTALSGNVYFLQPLRWNWKIYLVFLSFSLSLSNAQSFHVISVTQNALLAFLWSVWVYADNYCIENNLNEVIRQIHHHLQILVKPYTV